MRLSFGQQDISWSNVINDWEMSLKRRHVPFPSPLCSFLSQRPKMQMHMQPRRQDGKGMLKVAEVHRCVRSLVLTTAKPQYSPICLLTLICGTNKPLSCSNHCYFGFCVTWLGTILFITWGCLHSSHSIYSHLKSVLCILFFPSHKFHPNGLKLHMYQISGKSPKGAERQPGSLEKASVSWNQRPCS